MSCAVAAADESLGSSEKQSPHASHPWFFHELRRDMAFYLKHRAASSIFRHRGKR